MPSLNTKLASAPNTTTNYVLKATSSSTIGNSLFSDNGTNGAFGGANYSAGTGVRTFNITSSQYAGIAFWTDSGYSGDIFSYFSSGNMVIMADPSNIMGASNLILGADGTTIATLNTTNVTLARPLSGTSATFSGSVNLTGSATTINLLGTSYGNIAADKDLYIDAGGSSAMYLRTNGGSAGLTITSAGRLDVAGEIRMTGSTLFRGMSSSTLQLCGGLSSSNVKIDGSAESVSIDTNGATRFTISSNGTANFSNNVISPQFRISASGTFRVNANDDSLIGFMLRSGSWKGTTENNLAFATDGPYGIAFFTNGSASERMFISTAGRVGIENTAPQGKLEVGRTASNTTAGGHFFSTFVVPVNTWTTIFYAPNNNWNAITEFTWTSSGDYNRSGAAYMRWAYVSATNTLGVVYTLFNNDQNAAAQFRNSGGEIQVYITGGASSYYVQVRIQGSQAA